MPISTRTLAWFGATVWALSWPGIVLAGMPSFTIADISRHFALSSLTRMRLEVISFFLLGLVLCAWMIRMIWNSLRKDFPILPRLSFGKAMGLVVLWGFLFVLVLTMISGARELMTPGAWEKNGLTYRLVDEFPPPVERQITARTDAIRRLGTALREYAQVHRQEYPPAGESGAIPDAHWVVPDAGGARYVYVGGRMVEEDSRYPLAYEPDSVGPDRLVLFNDGAVVWMPIAAIEGILKEKRP